MLKALNKYFWILLIFLCFNSFVYAVEPLPKILTNLNSEDGHALLKKNLSLNTTHLLSQFTTQLTTTYCGVASAVMILNASALYAPLDNDHPGYHYFNQTNFFNEKVKSFITPEAVSHNGMTLLQLNKALQFHQLKTHMLSANELNLKTFREKLVAALSKNQFVIVNFLRTELKQSGDGHHSPLAAYDQKTDQFLLLDVARYKYPAYWVKSKDLWKAVNTLDGKSYRGAIIVYNSGLHP